MVVGSVLGFGEGTFSFPAEYVTAGAGNVGVGLDGIGVVGTEDDDWDGFPAGVTSCPTAALELAGAVCGGGGGGGRGTAFSTGS